MKTHEELLIIVKEELRYQNRNRSYPFFHMVSNMRFLDVNTPLARYLLEISLKIHK